MIEIQTVEQSDFTSLLALNEDAVPHVNSIDSAQMADFLQQAVAFFKVVEAGQLAGFVISLGGGADYLSPNYTWFDRELKNFLYIDRIMVDPTFRRQGVARLIYQELEDRARAHGITSLCCEVNLMPPNPESLALHLSLGFVQVGTQFTYGGEKEVVLLVKQLDTTNE
ncbi:MAG: GNAT family N-acetyltransferase [SAR86 cluster bacterium]|uniref:GNAT family N-acetyltransferase n=1 Tax=SAR86 cluster bacterium TaxID=2030880 RepID=A0A973AA22_9GAMM|nr:GNAT family N-acetyltransferase [SAR86 cluster bacterium]